MRTFFDNKQWTGFTIFLLGFLMTSASTFSQNIETENLVWEVSKSINLQTQDTIAYTGKFVTHALNNVEWIQRNGGRTSVYQVTGSEVSWANVSEQGSFTYLLNKNGNDASMTVEKNSAGTYTTLKFVNAGENFRLRFIVQSVEPSN